jgi:hypothetical protein
VKSIACHKNPASAVARRKQYLAFILRYLKVLAARANSPVAILIASIQKRTDRGGAEGAE